MLETLNYKPTWWLPFIVKHVTVAVTNPTWALFPYLLQATIHMLVHVHLQMAFPPLWFTWLNEPMVNVKFLSLKNLHLEVLTLLLWELPPHWMLRCKCGISMVLAFQ